jgi:hypothetical protein
MKLFAYICSIGLVFIGIEIIITKEFVLRSGNAFTAKEAIILGLVFLLLGGACLYHLIFKKYGK